MRFNWFSWSRVRAHESGVVAAFILCGCLVMASICIISNTIFGLHVAVGSGSLAVVARKTPSSNSGLPTARTRFASTTRSQLVKSYGKLPLSFEANRGQTASQVKYLSRGGGYTVFLTKNSAVLELKKPSSVAQGFGTADPSLAAWNHQNQPMTLLRGPAAVSTEREPSPQGRDAAHSAGAVVRMRLIGAEATVRVAGAEELPGKSNYLIGNNPKKWHTDVPTYSKVEYKSVYPGLDLVYYGNQRQLEYDFMVAPGADPGVIRLGIDARNSKVEIAKNGDLVIHLREDEVRFRKPVAYQPASPVAQQRHKPSGRYPSLAARHFLNGKFVLLASDEVGFNVADYDHTRPLVIDPVLAYSTYLDGTGGGADAPAGIATDSSGSVYVTGYTNSDDFPTTTGAYQETFVGGTCQRSVFNQSGTITIVASYNCSDVFVTKLNPLGTALVYSTYIGGSSPDEARGIAVDSAGLAYVTGYTGSSDFPLVNAIQVTNPVGNSFVTKLNAAGNGLVYSTYLGGSTGGTVTGAIAVDTAGSAYVTGQTGSTDFPTTPGSLQPTDPSPTLCTLPSGVSSCLVSSLGCPHAFAVKINAAGSAFDYSTYLGGACDNDQGNGIAVDSSGNAYIAGRASPAGTPISPAGNFPTTPGSYQPGFASAPCSGGPCEDAFVTKLNSTGSALIYSTLLGGTAIDFANGVALDSSDNAYLAGGTQSPDFPILNGSQTALTGTFDVFVTKLNAAGSALAYSTYLGGSGGSIAYGIAVDVFGSAYVAGNTNSTDFPVMNATQAALGGGMADGFVAKLNAAGNALDFSTYLGGSSFERAYAISLDNSGNAYVTGLTGVGNFPITAGALQSQGPSTAHCIDWPSGYVPFTQITSQNGDLVVGYTTVTAYQELLTFPLPTFPGEGFCTVAELAPGQYFYYAADPDTAERNGNFSAYRSIIDPTTGQPFANNIIPPNELGMVFAWPVYGLQPPTDPFVVKISGFPAAGPAVTFYPNSADFGSAVVSSSSSAQTVTLGNWGANTITISNISVTGTDSGDFSQSNTCGTSLSTGSSCDIGVTFSPTAGGTRGALLSVSDDAASSPQTAALSGTGQDFALDASSASQTVAAGATASYDLVLSPQSGFAQTVDLSCSGAPSKATCTVSPASVTLDGTNTAAVSVTVTTTAASRVAPGPRGGPPPPGGFSMQEWWIALLLLLLMGALALAFNKGRRRVPLMAGAVLLAAIAMSCGGGGGGTTVTNPGTPKGTSTLTVTGTSGSLQHSTTMTLTVQ